MEAIIKRKSRKNKVDNEFNYRKEFSGYRETDTQSLGSPIQNYVRPTWINSNPVKRDEKNYNNEFGYMSKKRSYSYISL